MERLVLFKVVVLEAEAGGAAFNGVLVGDGVGRKG